MVYRTIVDALSKDWKCLRGRPRQFHSAQSSMTYNLLIADSILSEDVCRTALHAETAMLQTEIHSR